MSIIAIMLHIARPWVIRWIARRANHGSILSANCGPGYGDPACRFSANTGGDGGGRRSPCAITVPQGDRVSGRGSPDGRPPRRPFRGSPAAAATRAGSGHTAVPRPMARWAAANFRSHSPSFGQDHRRSLPQGGMRCPLFRPTLPEHRPVRAIGLSRFRAGSHESGWVHAALERGWVGRLDAQHDKGGAVAFAQPAHSLGDALFADDSTGGLDPRTGGDLFQLDAEAGVALLIAGLAVMAVVDANDREIRRVQHCDRGKRADIHQQLAVAGYH